MQPIPPSTRCLVINRWDDDFAAYHRYIDHHRHRVAYITHMRGSSALFPELAAHIEIVPDLDDGDAVHEAALRCRDKLGGVDKVIALSEFDLICASRLRAELNVAGALPDEVARFRDKTVMKHAVLAAGLRAPAFARLEDAEEVEALIWSKGFPLMVKPKAGAASIGCHRVDTRDEFDRLSSSLAQDEYECEEFIEGPIFHVDGLVAKGRIIFAKASRYINTCYAFSQGKPLGSILLDPGEPARALCAFTGDCLAALGLSDGAFHLEVISGAAGLCFLEVGARVGGGEIPFIMRDLFGVDLFREWVRIEFGHEEIRIDAAADQHRSVGFLMLPEPVGTRLTARSGSLIGRVPGLYEEVLPPVGHVFDGSGGYDSILGRFRYHAASENEVEAAIDATLRAYTYQLQDIGRGGIRSDPAALSACE